MSGLDFALTIGILALAGILFLSVYAVIEKKILDKAD